MSTKYFVALLLSAMLGGRAAAQSNDSIDYSQTLTHKTSLDFKHPTAPKNRAVKFCNANEAVIGCIHAFGNVTADDAKTAFAPFIILQPFVRFYDKVTLRFIATPTIMNYPTNEVSASMRNMYAQVDVQTKIGTFNVKYGKLSELNYAPDFIQFMPVSTFLINMGPFDSSRTFPRAICGGYSNKTSSVSFGYAEETPGLKFTGDGYVVIAFQQKFGEQTSFGGLIMTNRQSSIINTQFKTAFGKHSKLLLQGLNLTDRPIVHATYCFDCGANHPLAIAANGFYQSKKGIAGGTVSAHHKPSGAYVAVGAYRGDPKRTSNPNNTKKFSPLVEFGLTKMLRPRGH